MQASVLTWFECILFMQCVRYFQIHRFQYRHLTANEIQLAKPIFANRLDYSKVLIFNIPYLPWQPIGLFMAPTGALFVHPENYKTDYSLESLAYQSIFIHELTHIYQHQHHINVLLRGAILQTGYYLSFKRFNPYVYSFDNNRAFASYNIEQQAEIAKDIFLGNIPNIIVSPSTAF